MDGDGGYALQKLELSIIDLAIGAGDIRSRLHYVFMEHLHIINERDFPNEFKNDWSSIYKALTKKGPVINEEGKKFTGSVQHTLRGMKNKSATKIARDIVVLSGKLRGYFGDLAKNNP